MATFQLEDERPVVTSRATFRLEDEIPDLAAEAVSPSQISPIAAIFGKATLLASIPFFLLSATLFLLPGTHPRQTLGEVISFSYIPEALIREANSGWVRYFTFIGDRYFACALTAAYAALLLTISLSCLIPYRRKSPFGMQACVHSFFVAFIVTLLIFDTVNLDMSLLVACARLFWIVIAFAIAERVKLAYRPGWIGGEYFPTLVDGLFAIAATLILSAQLDQRFSEAFSGPVFLLIAFLMMSVLNPMYARGKMRSSLMTWMDLELPEGERSKRRLAAAIARASWGRFIYLHRRTHEELEKEYVETFGKSAAAAMSAFPREASRPLLYAFTVMMVVWGFIISLPLWLAFNVWLAILPG